MVALSLIGTVSLTYFPFGMLNFVVSFLFGLPPRGYTVVVGNLARVAVGILGLLTHAASRLAEVEQSAGHRAY